LWLFKLHHNFALKASRLLQKNYEKTWENIFFQEKLAIISESKNEKDKR
jgi:hypothetical protein